MVRQRDRHKRLMRFTNELLCNYLLYRTKYERSVCSMCRCGKKGEQIMKYRKFGKTDFQASVLGFGAMRLPTVEGKVDETQATEMLYYAIENGVNYVDTAYIYHGGESEKWLGKALKESYRDKVKLATKLPCWDVHQPSDFDKFFNEQLGRLQTDHIDFYLFHSLNRYYW
jgi:predicted aldo/keto reductase-like oxidoreductase